MNNKPEPIKTDSDGRQYAPSWVHAVLPETIVDQREKGWPDFHPEDFCHRCGRRNPNWWTTDVHAWTHAMSGRERRHLEIVCPSCFGELHGSQTLGIHIVAKGTTP